jgi:hypothetical protein
MFAGCAGSANGPAARTLPPAAAAGSLFEPVPHPTVREGDDARLALARYAAALTTANRRIEGARRWYEGIRESYAKGGQ